MTDKTDSELLAELDKIQYLKSECTSALPDTLNKLVDKEKDILAELKIRFTFH